MSIIPVTGGIGLKAAKEPAGRGHEAGTPALHPRLQG